MNRKANGCWPVVVVAAVLALGSASARACETAKCDRTAAADSAASSDKSSRHGRHHAHHTSHSRHETKSADRAKSEKVRVATAGELPPAVANAQAQMPGDQAPPPAASAQPAPAPVTAAAPAEQPQSADTETPVVAADELNEVDRAAMADKPAGRILHLLPQTQQLSSAAPEDTWTQTSLLGKMFVVMGGCLTLASAARMFIA